MRSLCIVAILAVSWVAPAEQAPSGIVRGSITGIGPGSLAVTVPAGTVYECAFDRRTYMERDGQRIFGPALRTSDPVELITDRTAGGSCYARTIRVVRAHSVTPLKRPPLPRPYRALDQVFPRGNMTFAGVVRRLNNEMMVLRTRTEPEKIVLLRDDTRYLAGGLPSDWESLAVNTRVFVRAGRNFENDVEAYQVIWGEIAGPSSAR